MSRLFGITPCRAYRCKHYRSLPDSLTGQPATDHYEVTGHGVRTHHLTLRHDLRSGTFQAAGWAANPKRSYPVVPEREFGSADEAIAHALTAIRERGERPPKKRKAKA